MAKQPENNLGLLSNSILEFPIKSKLGRIVPKDKIYENASASTKLKELFVNEVEKITWSNKLSKETVNLEPANGVEEIQIFTIRMKSDSLNHAVLKAIDKAIPSPIIFILSYRNKIRYAAAHKRQSEANNHKHVTSSYFESAWIPDDAPRTALPLVLNTDALYQSLIKGLIPVQLAEVKEDITELIDRSEEIHKLEKQITKLEQKLKREKQFNRKVELNQQIKVLIKQVEVIKGQ